jgi:hypothetical protein
MSNHNYHQERGEGRIKFLLTLLVLAAFVYVTLQFVPVYWRSIQMQDATETLVKQAALRPDMRETDLRAQLEQKADEFNLPDNKRIELTRNGKKVMARVIYTHDIVLPFYTYKWSFDFRKEDAGF